MVESDDSFESVEEMIINGVGNLLKRGLERDLEIINTFVTLNAGATMSYAMNQEAVEKLADYVRSHEDFLVRNFYLLPYCRPK